MIRLPCNAGNAASATLISPCGSGVIFVCCIVSACTKRRLSVTLPWFPTHLLVPSLPLIYTFFIIYEDSAFVKRIRENLCFPILLTIAPECGKIKSANEKARSNGIPLFRALMFYLIRQAFRCFCNYPQCL